MCSKKRKKEFWMKFNLPESLNKIPSPVKIYCFLSVYNWGLTEDFAWISQPGYDLVKGSPVVPLYLMIQFVLWVLYHLTSQYPFMVMDMMVSGPLRDHIQATFLILRASVPSVLSWHENPSASVVPLMVLSWLLAFSLMVHHRCLKFTALLDEESVLT